jgi:hypothetical protein
MPAMCADREAMSTERNHQGLSNQLLRSDPIVVSSQPVQRRQRPGGMLSYYHRAACGPHISGTAADAFVSRLIREHDGMIGRC